MEDSMIKLFAVVLPFAATGLVVFATARGDVPTLPAKATHESSHAVNGHQFNRVAAK